MKKLLFLLILIPMTCLAQDSGDRDSTRIFKKYLNVRADLSAIFYRDFATSPLMYSGLLMDLGVGLSKDSELRERNLHLLVGSGVTLVSVGSETSVSTVRMYDLSYDQLFKIGDYREGTFKFYAGPMADVRMYVRYNSSLGNNASGAEVFGTLFGSVKAVTDASRKKAVERNIWFIHYTKKPKIRNLSFRGNLGLLNTNYRNPYEYMNQSFILGDGGYFENYKLHWFDGLRLSSEFALTRVYTNGNKVKWAYNWDAMRTSDKVNLMEVAHHMLSCTLYFNTK